MHFNSRLNYLHFNRKIGSLNALIVQGTRTVDKKARQEIDKLLTEHMDLVWLVVILFIACLVWLSLWYTWKSVIELSTGIKQMQLHESLPKFEI